MKLVKEAGVQIYCIGIGDTNSGRDFPPGKSCWKNSPE
jgi:hypothetical protein